MKLISLNIWGGHEFEPLKVFLKAHEATTDVFCLQEVYSCSQPLTSRGTRLNVLEELQKILPDHQLFFAPTQDNIDEVGAIKIPSTFGQAIFVKKNLRVEKEGFVFTYRSRNAMEADDFGTLGTGFQHIRLRNGGTPLTILSVHGLSLPGDKLDTPDRLAQSQKIKDFLKDVEGQKIICGDFNLMPETQSVKILEKDMRNLIREFDIPTTRGGLNAQKYPSDSSPQRFADYLFISPDINVIHFEVPNIPISDHLPLILEFS